LGTGRLRTADGLTYCFEWGDLFEVGFFEVCRAKASFRIPIEMAATGEYNVKILLVEDSKPIRRENESALHKAGYEVISVEDGETALRMAREQRPDLILLDMILPKMTAEIPVVVLRSLSEKNRQRLLEAGAEEYLEKNSMMPGRGINLLPKALENVICRINRKRGVAFSTIPLKD
jgi:CheY-like chemotaxis protein